MMRLFLWIVYFPYWLLPPRSSFLALRTAEDLKALAASVRATLSELEPEAAITHVETMDELVGSSVAQRRFEFEVQIAFAGRRFYWLPLGSMACSRIRWRNGRENWECASP